MGIPPGLHLLLLLIFLLSLGQGPAAVVADCTTVCSTYPAAIQAPNSTQCLLDCINCNPYGQTSTGGSNGGPSFYPTFSSDGAYQGCTCQYPTDSLPAWAIVAITLGSLVLICVITCIVMCFVCRCCKHQINAQKEVDLIRYQQQPPVPGQSIGIAMAPNPPANGVPINMPPPYLSGPATLGDDPQLPLVPGTPEKGQAAGTPAEQGATFVAISKPLYPEVPPKGVKV